jgi:chromosome segregation ATPase
MELEEIVSRLAFLEEERRKNKNQINSLERKITSLETLQKTMREEVSNFRDNITGLSVITEKIDQHDAALTKIRKDFNRSIQNIEKLSAHESSATMDVGALNKLASEMRKGLTSISEVKKNMAAKATEELRTAKTIDAIKGQLAGVIRQNEEFAENVKVMEESQRQDTKRVADFLADITTLRKRIEDNKSKGNVSAEKMKDLENKFIEFQTSETDRKQSLVSLIEKQNLQQVERNRLWKEWQSRFDVFSEKALFFEKQTQNLEVTLQSLKSAQEKFEDINQRLDRRINEVTEMQRLTDEKFRQDWMSFRAEDQKRWTNFNVGHDELQRETARQLENTLTRLSALEEVMHDVREAIVSLGNETNQRLQTLIKMSNDWMDSNERLIDIGS